MELIFVCITDNNFKNIKIVICLKNPENGFFLTALQLTLYSQPLCYSDAPANRMNNKDSLNSMPDRCSLCKTLFQLLCKISLNSFLCFRSPSAVQLEACLREAEKLSSLVNMQSPRIVSELSLSSLTAASIVHTEVTHSSGDNSQSFNVSLIVSLLLLLIMRT